MSLLPRSTAKTVIGEKTAREKIATSPHERGRNTSPSDRMNNRSSARPTRAVSLAFKKLGISESQRGE